MKTIKNLSVLLIGFALYACQKDATLIVDNTAPPDNTIESIVARNFLNRAYIGLLGRKPTDSEFNDGLNTLNSNNMSMESRKTILNSITSQTEFRLKVLRDAKADYLRSITDADIDEMITVYNLLIQDPNNAIFVPLIQNEINRLQILKGLPNKVASGELNIRQMHKILVNNHFYDDFNMGSENFVTSTFQTFLFRYPTISELTNGVKMVDGFSAILFFKGGSSKNDYIEIFFEDDGYYEGRVRYVFNQFLFRTPNTEEFKKFTSIYKNSDDYAQLVVEILSLDEFAGL